MAEQLTAKSFIVRVYRVDTEDTRKVTGLVEILDGSGRQEHFRDIDELAGLLQSGACASQERVRKAKRKERRHS